MADGWIPEGELVETSTTPAPPPPPQEAAPQQAPAPPPEEAPPVDATPPPADTWIPEGEGGGPAPQAAAPLAAEDIHSTEGIPEYVPGGGDARSQSGTGQQPVETVLPPDQYDPNAVKLEPGSPEQEAALAQHRPSATSADVTPSEVTPPPEAVGPLQQAANALGQFIAPVTEQLPQPVQNLTDIVGQPVGGTIDAAQSIANELGQGDIPGAIGAGLGALSGPWARGVEQTGANIAAGQPAIPTPGEMIANPANILAFPSGVASRYGPAPAVTGQTEEAWFASLPPDQQASLAAQGGVAMNQAWLQAIGSSPVPPPQLSNPFEAATSGNPLERAGQVVGAIPQFAGGYLTSAKQGTLAPFLLSQGQNIVEDPLFWLDRAGVHPGEFAQSRTLNAARKIPIVDQAINTVTAPIGRAVGRLTDYTPEEQARLAADVLTGHVEEYTRAGITQLPTAGWPTGPVPPPREPVPLYHGTMRSGIDTLKAVIPAEQRRWSNPMAELGVFTTPDLKAAGSYADIAAVAGALDRTAKGVVYEAKTPLKNPARFDFQQFWEKYSDEAPVPPAPRQIRDLKDSLIGQGHDGIVLTDQGGNVKEVVFFQDVPVAQARNAVRSAYKSTPVSYQHFIESIMPVDPHFHRGVVASAETIAAMKEPAGGRLRFRDGVKPEAMSVADVVATTNEGIHSWLRGFDRSGTPLAWTQGTDKRARAWQALQRRFNPRGDIDPRPMMAGLQVPGARISAADRRADFLVNVLTDAIQASLPVAERSRLATAFGQWTNVIRQSMLFNILNVPRYISQNLTSNSINEAVRGGGLRPVIDTWTDVKEMGRRYGHVKDNSPTTVNAVIKHTGMGDFPNVQMTQRPYFDTIAGPMPKGLGRLLSLVAPEAGRFLASVPDLGAREDVFLRAVEAGYRELNTTLVPTTYERFRHQMPTQMPSLEKFRQVSADFLNQNRNIPDPRTGEALTGLFGTPDRYEPMWNPDAYRAYLKEHLFEDVPLNQRPNAGQINRAVNDLTGTLRDSVRTIGKEASATVDDALFPWRNTVLDEGLGQITLFHYYMTRQGGFYVSEMAKHPWVAAAYGRMMAEMERQNEELGGPAWMTGWFQFMQSVGGFSTWFSPKDFVTSLFTMAEWQMPSDPDKYTDLTRVGQAMQAFPFLVHPMIQGLAYGIGLLGPDYPAPALTGTETFGAKAIQLLNLANAEGVGFMKPFNAMGIGVDRYGNTIPLAPRPLQDLYATVGHGISQALMPITGLAPVEVTPSWATFTADVQAIGEQETRKAHPEWDDGSDEGQMQIDNHVTDVLADPGNVEYQAWYQLAASQPLQLGAGVPQPIAGALRIASPIQIRTSPEQRVLDQRKGALRESGNAPMRTLDDALSDEAFQSAKGAISSTVEGRRLDQMQSEYEAILPAGLADARAVMAQITHFNFESGESPPIAGQTYTNDELEKMSSGERYNLTQQYLTEQGFSDHDNQGYYTAQNEYLADHPDLAAYTTYKSLISQAGGPEVPYEEKARIFTEQMMQTNPSFAQYVRSSMTDHITGQINYKQAFGSDAYLASQGQRGSVYSPIAGNEPSTAPGGYPSIPGVEPGQPTLPEYHVYSDTFVYQKPTDISYRTSEGEIKADPRVATLKPDFPIVPIGAPRTVEDTWNGVAYQAIQVASTSDPERPIGWVDLASLTNTTVPRPIGQGTVPQPGGGLVQQAGNLTNALGGAKEALGGAIGGALGGVGEAIGGAMPTPDPVAAPPQTAPAAPPPALSGGGIGDVLGGIARAAGSAIGSITGHNSGAPVKPTTAAAPAPGFTPGNVVLEPALDGMGIQADPVPTDETWVEDMFGGHAAVTMPYKSTVTYDVDYSYQDGHGAQKISCATADDPNKMCFVHAAMDITCDDPNGDCEGTPVSSPITGTVLCAGYGVGDTGLADRTCDFAKGTTNAYTKDMQPSAHTVVLDVGTDADGNRLYMTFNHMGTTKLKPGQQINVGDAIGTMGNTDAGPHTHLEAWGESPELGQTRILDPHLVVSGYYATHRVDDASFTTAP
jgi:hypothetical protein